MTGLTWLHLSDWHQKGSEFDRQVVFSALLRDIRERTKINPDLEKIDFVVFSGDVAFSGKPEEYQAAKEQFFQPILDALGLKPNQLFIVPGNHDLDRDEFRLLPRELTKPLASEKDVQEWLTDDRRRSRLLEPFQAFASFVREYTGQEPPDYVNVRRMKIGKKEVALLGLNSAWICGRNNAKIGDKGFVIVGEPQIYGILEGISDADLKIVVLHHPFDWLTEFDCNRIETRIMQGCDFILRGHQHKPRVEIASGTSGDCVIIPAGASYNRRISENPIYANSCNYVHLDFDTGKGIVFLRRWSDPRNKWLEDIDSCDGGKCEFNVTKFKSEVEPTESAPQLNKIIPHQIPPPPADFKGREEEIRDILSNFDKGATITGLRGMAGVGKTVLAFVLADRLKDSFPDGQLFINLQGTSKSPLSPAGAMAQVIHACRPRDRLPENQDELQGQYHSILTGRSTLLLFDNAANREQVEPLLPPTNCAVLITSRIKFTLPGLKEKDLDVLPTDKACELLLGIAERIGDRAEELAKLCGNLPLALRNAASVLAERRDLVVAEYERLLSDKRKRLELVEASFSLSYDLLSPMRRKQWGRISVFPEDFDRNGAAAIWKMGQDPSAEALGDLVKWNLVVFNPFVDSEGDGRYRLHDLAQIFADSRLDSIDRADAQYRHAKHYLKVLDDAEKLYKMGGKSALIGLKLFDTDWANIRTGFNWTEDVIRNVGKSNTDVRLKSAFQLADSYPDKAGDIFELRQHPHDRIHWLEIALIANRRIRNRNSEGAHLSNLGNAYIALGESRKAIEYYQQASKKLREITDWKGEGDNLGNLGCAYLDLGEIRKAIGCFEKTLKIARKAKDRNVESNDLSNLGEAYAILGEMQKAIEYYEQALEIAQEIENKRNEGIVSDNLGSIYIDLGEIDKALEYLEQGLKINREIASLRFEGKTLCDLGRAYTVLGQTNKAVEYYNRSLEIACKNEDRKAKGDALCNLGRIHIELGEYLKAIRYLEQALELVRKIEFRKVEGDALCNLGRAYAGLNESGKAIEHYKQALDIARKIEYRKVEGEAQFYMSLVLDKLGQRQEAIELAKSALAIFEQIENPRAEKVKQNLAEWQSSSESEKLT